MINGWNQFGIDPDPMNGKAIIYETISSELRVAVWEWGTLKGRLNGGCVWEPPFASKRWIYLPPIDGVRLQ